MTGFGEGISGVTGDEGHTVKRATGGDAQADVPKQEVRPQQDGPGPIGDYHGKKIG